MDNGKRTKNIVAHSGGATCLQFLHDGRLVSGGRDRTVKLWGGGGNQIRQFEPFGELVMKVAATHDGGRIVAGDWSGEVRLAAVADGKIVAGWPQIRPRWKWPFSSGRPKRRPPVPPRRKQPRGRRGAEAVRQKRRVAKTATEAAAPPPRPPRASPRKKRPWRRRSSRYAAREFAFATRGHGKSAPRSP